VLVVKLSCKCNHKDSNSEGGVEAEEEGVEAREKGRELEYCEVANGQVGVMTL